MPKELTKQQAKNIWDYQLKSRDLKNPEILKWYLERKINFGDWSGIRLSDLKKNLTHLNIDPGVKKLLSEFIKYNDKSNP